MKYSKIFYDNLQYAYDYFNEYLFNSELPQCVLTLQRKNGVCGYFKQNSFTNSECTNIAEIAINPTELTKPITEVLQTLAHEQAHLLHSVRGHVCRKGFHDQKWIDIMVGIGLQPTDPKTGQDCNVGGSKMSDRIIPGGIFDLTCQNLLKEIKFDLVSVVEIKEKKKKKKSKWIYVCPECNDEATLKRNDKNIICGDCGCQMCVEE